MGQRGHRGIQESWWALATGLALLAVLLMPVHYRAGAAYPHGHALLQLIHEAHAGAPVHHAGAAPAGGAHHTGDLATSQDGAPSLQLMPISALLPLVLAALALHALRPTTRFGSAVWPAGRSLAPGHPPPRSGALPTASP